MGSVGSIRVIGRADLIDHGLHRQVESRQMDTSSDEMMGL